ncbi:MAG: hypothetical protein FWD15_04415 [Alphaproteobacteria bacterium]|nr:hypothetical protein [Alphaproteobacteria bacterium]
MTNEIMDEKIAYMEDMLSSMEKIYDELTSIIEGAKKLFDDGKGRCEDDSTALLQEGIV